MAKPTTIVAIAAVLVLIFLVAQSKRSVIEEELPDEIATEEILTEIFYEYDRNEDLAGAIMFYGETYWGLRAEEGAVIDDPFYGEYVYDYGGKLFFYENEFDSELVPYTGKYLDESGNLKTSNMVYIGRTDEKGRVSNSVYYKRYEDVQLVEEGGYNTFGLNPIRDIYVLDEGHLLVVWEDKAEDLHSIIDDPPPGLELTRLICCQVFFKKTLKT